MKKKVNPRNIPVSQADLNKAVDKTRDETFEIAWAMFFSVMRDKEGYGKKRLSRLWNHVFELSDSMAKGYVTPNDLRKTLKTESRIISGGWK